MPTQSSTAPARAQNEFFEPVLFGRSLDISYESASIVSQAASVGETAGAHHVNAPSAAATTRVDIDT